MNLKAKQMKNKILIASIVFLITAVSRFIYFEQSFGGFSYDSGSFTLAVQDYNITEWRPHLPGYYLYVQTLRLFLLFTGDIHSAMKWLIILFSSLAIGLLYWVLRRWFDDSLSLLLVGITLTNPLVWFYGSITEIYAFDLFYSIALVGLCYSNRGIYISPLFLGFFSGFRPSSAVLLFPLYIFLWYRHIKSSRPSVEKIATAHLIGALGFLLWFVPMVSTAGGLKEYISLYRTHNPVQDITLLQNWYRMSSFTVFMLIPFIIPVIFWIIEKSKLAKLKSSQISNIRMPMDFVRMSLWWLLPPSLFFILFHYSKGYYLLNAIPIFGLIIFLVRRSRFKYWLLGSSIVLQILVFIAAPYSLPNVQTCISRQNRQFNLAEVWWARTKSVFLMASSQIRALDEIADEFEIASSQFEGKGRFIFLDPTFPISPRAMQAKYPQLKFTAFSYSQEDRYQLYTGLITRNETGLKTMIGKAIIASRTDFVNQYLQDVSLKMYHSPALTFYTIKPQNLEITAIRYDSLFSRIK
jgi:hypothetical protein